MSLQKILGSNPYKKIILQDVGVGKKKLKKLNLSKNLIETELKNRLTKSNGSILVFVLHKSRFQLRFQFTQYKNHDFG